MTNKIIKYLILFSVFHIFLNAGNIEECPLPNQENGVKLDKNGFLDVGKSKYKNLWECPALQNISNGLEDKDFRKKLYDVDFSNGSYVCNYAFKSTGQHYTSCKFTSTLYVKIMEKTEQLLKGHIEPMGAIEMGLLSKNGSIDISKINFSDISISPQFTKAFSKWNETRLKLKNITKSIKVFDPNSKEQQKKIKNMYNRYADEASKFHDIQTDLEKIITLSYTHLVEPYAKPSHESNVRKGYTFSNFIAGLITLDPLVIKGYNMNNGEIIIQPKWKEKSSNIKVEAPTTSSQISKSIGDFFSSFFSYFSFSDTPTGDGKKAGDMLYNGDMQYVVYSYIRIFEMKIWGFYYFLQERFDIAFDVTASTLLYLFSIWYVGIVFGTEGVKYLINRTEHEHKSSEEYWLKTVLILASIGIFYLSIPSSLNDTGGGGTKQNEIKRNYTIAKSLIRQTAQWGANTATMFSDLGLDAFINFIVKKEQILSIDDIRLSQEKSLLDFYMIPSATDLRNQCKDYYNTTDSDFYSSIDELSFTINPKWAKSEWAKSRGISGLNYEVCRKAYGIFAYAPYQIAEAQARAEEELKNANNQMSEAVLFMVQNQIALEDKMGWVSSFSVPITYFLMKKSDMFISRDIDNNAIREQAQKYMGVIVKDGDNMEKSSFWGSAEDNAAKTAAKVLDVVNGLYFYNILPGFSGIQTSIQNFGDKVYGDRLEIALKTKKSNKGKNLKKWMRNQLKKGMSKTFVGLIGNAISSLTDIKSTFLWHTVILGTSYGMAIYVWNAIFSAIFMVAISLLFLVTFLLYFKDLMKHFIASLFVFLWAFTKNGTGHGEGKIKDFMKNTILLVFFKPIMLIVGGYLFIFTYEMMTVLYSFVFETVLVNLEATTSLMATANKNTGIMDATGAYTTINGVRKVASIFVDLFGLYIAYVSILKAPDYFMQKMGVSTDDTRNAQQITENIAGKQDRDINPMSKG